jgi:hypothetical protein
MASVRRSRGGDPRESSNPFFQDIRTLRENGRPHQNKDTVHRHMQGEIGEEKGGGDQRNR